MSDNPRSPAPWEVNASQDARTNHNRISPHRAYWKRIISLESPIFLDPLRVFLLVGDLGVAFVAFFSPTGIHPPCCLPGATTTTGVALSVV